VRASCGSEHLLGLSAASVAGARSTRGVGHRLAAVTRWSSLVRAHRVPRRRCHRKHRRVESPPPAQSPWPARPARHAEAGTGRSSTRRQATNADPSRSFRSGCARNSTCRKIVDNERPRDHRLPRHYTTARRRWAATGRAVEESPPTRPRRNKGTSRSPTTRSASRWRARSCDCSGAGKDLNDLLPGRARWPHLGNVHTSSTGPSIANELVRRVCDCTRQLRAVLVQSRSHRRAHRRSWWSCVAAWSSGVRGCNLNRIRPAGVERRRWRPSWYPLYEAMASSTCRHDPRERTLQRHSTHRIALLGADTRFMQLMMSDVRTLPTCVHIPRRRPSLHWGRFAVAQI